MTKITANTPGLNNMIHVNVVGERANLTAAQLRRAYDWALSLWDQLGMKPEFLTANGAGIKPSRKRRSFRSMREKVERANLSEFRYVGFDTTLPGRDARGYPRDMAQFMLSNRPSNLELWYSFMSLFPAAIGISDAEAERNLLNFASLTAGRYGYVMYWRGCSASGYVSSVISGGGDFEPETQEDQTANYRWSGPYVAGREVVLRDLYPINLLVQHFLDLPFGDTGMTLERWIKEDASRGTLEPLTGAEHVTVWRPVIANIPQLRTELFTAGLLFYWRHFDPSQPEYRDFSKPLSPPKIIPAIFRPEFYAGRDPKVTR